MKTYFLAGTALLISAPVAAQQAQTADDFVCALAGECGDTAVTETEEVAAPTEKPKPKSRGFVLASGKPAAKPAAVAASTYRAAPVASAPVRVAARSAAAPRVAARAARRITSVASSAPVVAIAPGRGELKVEFVTGSSQLTEQAKSNARQFAAAITRPSLSSARFVIEGHTDAVGNREFNLELSRKRAQSVLDYLQSQSIDVSRLEVKGFGFDQPLDQRNPRSAVNRRVEVVKVN